MLRKIFAATAQQFSFLLVSLRQSKISAWNTIGKKLIPRRKMFAENEAVHKLYYFIREYLPVSFRRQLQRIYFRDWKKLPFPTWPVDFTVDTLHEEFLRLAMEASGAKRVPFIWFWPEGAANCLIMTHDVETSAGRDFTSKLMDLDDSYGIKASFQVVPEKRYEVPEEYVREIRSRGFEFNIHDLNHDGRLYLDRQEFVRRAARINSYVHRYGAGVFAPGRCIVTRIGTMSSNFLTTCPFRTSRIWSRCAAAAAR